MLGEISLRNVSQFFDQGGADTPERLLDDRARRDHLMHSCNALSISEATGILRERVQRTVALLIDKGWLVRDPHQRLMVDPRGDAGFTQRNAHATHDILELAHKLSALLRPVDAEQD